MQEALKALADLRQGALSFRAQGLLTVSHEKALTDLQKLVNRRDSRSSSRQPIFRLDANHVWQEWSAVHFDPAALSRLQWRTLCGSPTTALRRELISGLAQNPVPLQRLSNFLGIAYAYFAAWQPDTNHAANAEGIEQLLRLHLSSTYDSSKNRVIGAWKQMAALFGSSAAEQLARHAINSQKSVRLSAEELYLEPTSSIVVAARDIGAGLATDWLVDETNQVSESTITARWGWTLQNMLVKELTPECFRHNIARLITSRLPEQSPAFRQALISSVTEDRRLGDPRLPSSNQNWRFMTDKAKQVFLSWLAQRYIQLFFNLVVPPSDENRRRAEFWLHYAKRQGNIKDFQVAVSAEDLVKVQRSQEARDFSFARVSAASNASSAFLMEFHGHGERYIIVEFSETGNAACIYRKAEFEAGGTTLRHRSFGMETLKEISRRIDFIRHHPIPRGSWERGATEKLRNIGIAP
jgi:hypothetical protein